MALLQHVLSPTHRVTGVEVQSRCPHILYFPYTFEKGELVVVAEEAPAAAEAEADGFELVAAA